MDKRRYERLMPGADDEIPDGLDQRFVIVVCLLFLISVPFRNYRKGWILAEQYGRYCL